MLATVHQTSTYVSTIYVSSYDAMTITRTESDIDTVTISSADIATEIVTVTISNADLRRRALAAPTTPLDSHALTQKTPGSVEPVSFTNAAYLSVYKPAKLLKASCADSDRTAGQRGANQNVLRKRQTSQYTTTITTGTTTVTDVTTSTKTSTVGASSTAYTTRTTSGTSTTVLQAATTVRSTTTINLAHTDPSEPGTGPTGPPVPASGNSGLSTGAKAGIGAGAGAAAILILVLAGCLWRKRNHEKVAGLAANSQPEHILSSPGAPSAPYKDEKMLRDSITAPSSTAYSPVPPSSTLPEVAQGVSHGPYAYQAAGHEPSYAYGENPPQELWNAVPPQEMSASPRVGYVVPYYSGA